MDMSAFKSLFITEFNERYDVDHDGFLIFWANWFEGGDFNKKETLVGQYLNYDNESSSGQGVYSL